MSAAYPRLLIAGLLPVQNRRIMERFGRRADLRFVNSDVKPSAWAAASGPSVDKVIVSTKFISHKHTDNLPSDRLVRVNGSLSSICQAIEKILPSVLAAPTKAPEKPVEPTFQEETTPVAETHTPPDRTVHAVVCNFLNGFGPDQTLTPKEVAKLIKEPLGPVTASMVSVCNKGFLIRKSRGVYVTTGKQVAVVNRIRPKAYTKGHRKPSAKSLADRFAAMSVTAATLFDQVEGLRHVAATQKPGLEDYTERQLWNELARRKASK